MIDTKFSTQYGILKGVGYYKLNSEGTLQECTISEYNELATPYGVLVPQYEDAEARRKNTASLCFFSNGNLKSISLHDQISIDTSIGTIPAEYITFYESGEIRRIFPLNGKLSGYWSEEDELELAKDISFSFSFGSFSKKIIGIQFYKSGKIKSITFWPKEKIEVMTSQGLLSARVGISLYESGALKSLEPKIPTPINTPIGKVTAYDRAPIGVNGDINSLSFTEEGKVQSLLSYSTKVKVLDSKGIEKIYEPTQKDSLLFEEPDEVVPLKIEFYSDKVIFNSQDEYKIDENNFIISKITHNSVSKCSSCDSCSGCS